MSVMSVSAFALSITGTITEVIVKDNDIISVTATDGTATETRRLAGTPESKKAMLAVALTAKSSNSTIKIVDGTATNGDYGWRTIILK